MPDGARESFARRSRVCRLTSSSLSRTIQLRLSACEFAQVAFARSGVKHDQVNLVAITFQTEAHLRHNVYARKHIDAHLMPIARARLRQCNGARKLFASMALNKASQFLFGYCAVMAALIRIGPMVPHLRNNRERGGIPRLPPQL